MRFFLLLGIGLGVSSFLSGCHGTTHISRTQRQDAAFLTSHPGQYATQWMLEEVFDPYNGGNLMPTDPRDSAYLWLYADGEFTQGDKRNYSRGMWRVDQETERLALTYLMQNNYRIPLQRQDTLFRYRLLHRSQDSLILAVAGRHGMVELRYSYAGEFHQ